MKYYSEEEIYDNITDFLPDSKADCIMKLLTPADVTPVQHSRFDRSKKVDMTAVCERCRDDKFWCYRSLRGDEKYCPNCVAKMNNREEDD